MNDCTECKNYIDCWNGKKLDFISYDECFDHVKEIYCVDCLNVEECFGDHKEAHGYEKADEDCFIPFPIT